MGLIKFFADVGFGVSVTGHGDLRAAVSVVAAEDIDSFPGRFGVAVHDAGGVPAPVETSVIFPFQHDVAVGDLFIHQSGVGVIELFVPSQSANTEEVGFFIP